MNRDELLKLAERVEEAIWPQPTRELNRAVARAVGWGYQTPSERGRKHPAWFHPSDCPYGEPVFDSLHGTDVWREPLNYLGSLDAALTLVPKGCKVTIQTFGGPGPMVLVDPNERFVSAATPALALTAAALRALAAQGDG